LKSRDTLRVAVLGGVDQIDLDGMMEIDLEAQHRDGHEPAAALTTMADSLPPARESWRQSWGSG
jgi:flagellar motor component MotA